MKRRLVLLATLPVLLAACGAGQAGGLIEHPAGEALVLRMEVRGGFIGPDAVFSQLPSFTLLGDGRVLQPGAVDAIFPGPLLAPLQERRLTEDGLQAILREVVATGLFETSRTLPSVGVADAPDTVFTLHAAGREVVVTANALGIGSGAVDPDADARQKLLELSERLALPDQWIAGSAWADASWHAHRPSGYRLLVREADPAEAEPTGIGFNLVAWPVASDPQGGVPAAGGGRCLVATGTDADAWSTALARANTLTRWTHGARRYQVQPRPLLPGEPPECPSS